MELLDTNWTYPMHSKYEEDKENLSEYEGACISVVADFDWGFFAAGAFEGIARAYYFGFLDPDYTAVKNCMFPCTMTDNYSQDELYREGREYYALIDDEEHEIHSLHVSQEEAEEAMSENCGNLRVQPLVFHENLLDADPMADWSVRFFVQEGDTLIKVDDDNGYAARFVFDCGECDWERDDDLYEHFDDTDQIAFAKYLNDHSLEQIDYDKAAGFLTDHYGIQLFLS